MASGDSLFTFQALDNQPPDADFATLDTVLVASTDEPDDLIPVLDFDPGATNEHAEFSFVMPRHYGGGGLTVTVIWRATTATGNVKWDAAFKSFTDDVDDSDSKAYAAIQTVTATAASVAGEYDYAAITFTDGAQMDSIAVGEAFRMRLTRDSADAADTMNSNDAELVAVEIRET